MINNVDSLCPVKSLVSGARGGDTCTSTSKPEWHINGDPGHMTWIEPNQVALIIERVDSDKFKLNLVSVG